MCYEIGIPVNESFKQIMIMVWLSGKVTNIYKGMDNCLYHILISPIILDKIDCYSYSY